MEHLSTATIRPPPWYDQDVIQQSYERYPVSLLDGTRSGKMPNGLLIFKFPHSILWCRVDARGKNTLSTKGHKYKKKWLEEILAKFSLVYKNHYKWLVSKPSYYLWVLPGMENNVSDWYLV